MSNDVFKNIIEYENSCCLDAYKESVGSSLSKCLEVAHQHVILDLIWTGFYSKSPFSNSDIKDFFIVGNYHPQIVKGLEFEDEITRYCENLHLLYLRSSVKLISEGKINRGISKENMLAGGAVYTQDNIVKDIVTRTVDGYIITAQTKALDFACGTGRFYEYLIKKFVDAGITIERAITYCVDAVDIDSVAINILRLKALMMLPDTMSYELALEITNRIRCENALIPDIKLDGDIKFFQVDYKSSYYDIIVSNPPYLVLKPSKKTPKYLATEIKFQIKYFNTCGLYKLATEGMLNLYQLSIERMLSMLRTNGRLGVICPSTLFADKSVSKLRKNLILKNRLEHITYFPEKTMLFENNVTQATNTFYLTKDGETDTLSLSAKGKQFTISVSLIKNLFSENMEIPLISEKEWIFLEKLSKFKKLKDFPEIRNRRGELDLTLSQEYITNQNTGIRLIRGKMITPLGIVASIAEYVCPSFLDKKSEEFKSKDYNRIRLIGQNISNIDNKQRLRFVFCEPTDILGNSCNYLSADIDLLKKLLIILSSSLLNWRFNITSSNNHINNYELGELPMPDFDKVNSNIKFSNQELLDKYVCQIYDINYDSFISLIK